MRVLRHSLPTFASDYSGAVSALYELGGLVIVHGAHGCASNTVSYDEPRAWSSRSRVFTSGLTDMDCLLGKDDVLLDQVARTHRAVGGSFVAVVGTPNTMIVGTDYDAVARKAGERCGVPAFGVATTGTEYYDRGAARALTALARAVVFPGETADGLPAPVPGAVNLLGATPLDLVSGESVEAASRMLEGAGWRVLSTWAMGSALEDLARASRACANVVLTSCGLDLARWMEGRFGIPYVLGSFAGERSFAIFESGLRRVASERARRPASCPGVKHEPQPELKVEREVERETCANPQADGPRAIVVADPVLSSALGSALREDCGCPYVREATLLPGPARPAAGGACAYLDEDALVRELAQGGYDLLVADPMLARLLPPGSPCRLVPLVCPALSGRLVDAEPVLPLGPAFPQAVARALASPGAPARRDPAPRAPRPTSVPDSRPVV